MKGTPRTLDRFLKSDRRALVEFEGVFYGPEPLRVDPKLPEFIKEKFKGAKGRYGHMDAFETMLEVTAIKQVTEVPSSVPW